MIKTEPLRNGGKLWKNFKNRWSGVDRSLQKEALVKAALGGKIWKSFFSTAGNQLTTKKLTNKYLFPLSKLILYSKLNRMQFEVNNESKTCNSLFDAQKD